MFLIASVLSDIYIKGLAYLDPGSGSFLLQLLLAALIGIGVSIRVYWSKIKELFGVKPPREADDSDDWEDPDNV